MLPVANTNNWPLIRLRQSGSLKLLLLTRPRAFINEVVRPINAQDGDLLSVLSKGTKICIRNKVPLNTKTWCSRIRTRME